MHSGGINEFGFMYARLTLYIHRGEPRIYISAISHHSIKALRGAFCLGERNDPDGH